MPTRRLSLARAVTETLEIRRFLSATAIRNVVPDGYLDNTVHDLGGVIETAGRSAAEGPEDADYDIQVVFPDTTLTATQQAAFLTAAARWTAVLTADIVDASYTSNGQTINVDDVRIDATGPAIDGAGGVLGSAGPTRFRSENLALGSGKLLPITGSMRFDSADLANLQADGTLVDVITHEMGHVLGLGTLWGTDALNLRINTGTTNVAFTGANAVAEWKAIAGDNAQTTVPVSNGTDGDGNGSRDAHWREGIFYNELMTHALGTNQSNPGTSGNPLSRMTAASMQDLGYPGVNRDAADFYQLTARNPAPTIASLTSSTTSPAVGSSFTLTANNVADTDGGVRDVVFYRESNGLPGLQTQFPSADTLIATDTASPWAATTTLSAAGSATFYARATDTWGLVSRVSTTTVNAVGSTLPTAISTPLLAAASDTGVSNSDGITNDNTPTFSGTTNPNVTVTLFRGTTAIGSTTASTTGAWTITPAAIADGTYSITAVASNSAGSLTSSATSITIDTVGPQLLSRAFQFESRQAVTLQFNELPATLGTSDLTLVNTTTGTTVAAAGLSLASTGATSTLSFTNAGGPVAGTLADGRYTLTITGSGATDVAGNALTFGSNGSTLNFFTLTGDANRDAVVGFEDLVILAGNYNKSPRTFSQGNFDYSTNGLVDFADLVLLASRYNKSLPAGRGSLVSSGSGTFASDWARLTATPQPIATTRGSLFGTNVIKPTSDDTSVKSVLL